MKILKQTAFLAALGLVNASAVTVFIGDAFADGATVSGGPSTDSSNNGDITYAFYNNTYSNLSGADQLVTIENVNFFANLVSGSDVTAFVAILSGTGTAGADYSVISVSNAISATAGLNNVAYAGSNASFTLADGDTLVTGFHQDGRIVAFDNGGTVDYLSTGGNAIPGSTPGALTSDTNFGLTRTYSFNVELDVNPIPEPSSALLLGLGGLALLRRRR